MKLLVEHITVARRMVQSEPLKSAIVRELDPGSEIVDDGDLRGQQFLLQFLNLH